MYSFFHLSGRKEILKNSIKLKTPLLKENILYKKTLSTLMGISPALIFLFWRRM